ncbi:MAG: DegT/DnrJ/EryC1/StrS family aminotransferase [gamma proteobacterium endosymbiont of Lamellibrachia anaximandri]|nr:DegT/DnrJ/EryC1/StrS family aminotransferase [gamma proteobacterium endosymbiont of Lamellibrachia anaximandri]MBL3532335.1 DegT/DnrJ/EryC1/StrS family aminotransferase [gamma proteobacterium endosymbiont of Lamellibrachia anaximandri]
MQFIDLKAQYRFIQEDVNRRIQTVLEHGRYIMGPEVTELEEALAAYVGVNHCIGVSSGTDALLMAMMALNILPGDEVITTPFTFIATGETIALLGATPVFVDIDPATYNIDPDLIEEAITPKTRAIMPVSLYGQCANMDAINDIAHRHGLPVIEDGAQSFGATYKGKHSCGLSTIGCTSFFPSKPLGGYGDGGALFTNDEALAKTLREIRDHGQDRRYHHPRLGINGRLDSLQAAVLLAKLEQFYKEVELRQTIGDRYTTLINEHCSNIITPTVSKGNSSVYAQYTIQVKNREKVQSMLSNSEIPTAIHYPVPLNAQPIFSAHCNPADTPVSQAVAARVISLPMHPYLEAEDQKKIALTLKEIENRLE